MKSILTMLPNRRKNLERMRQSKEMTRMGKSKLIRKVKKKLLMIVIETEKSYDQTGQFVLRHDGVY